MLEASIFEIEKIQNVAKLASKADFDISTNRVREDVIQFVDEYLDKFRDIELGWSMKTEFENSDGAKLVRSFRPVELTMLIDNLIDNAGKAGAKNVTVRAKKSAAGVALEFLDDGKGLTDRFSADEFFEKGITDTAGSGIGLSHAKQIVEELQGTISISNGGELDGARVLVTFNQ